MLKISAVYSITNMLGENGYAIVVSDAGKQVAKLQFFGSDKAALVKACNYEMPRIGDDAGFIMQLWDQCCEAYLNRENAFKARQDVDALALGGHYSYTATVYLDKGAY